MLKALLLKLVTLFKKLITKSFMHCQLHVLKIKNKEISYKFKKSLINFFKDWKNRNLSKVVKKS